MPSSRGKKNNNIHPLLEYDPDSVKKGSIELLKLEYFEAESTKAPVPRSGTGASEQHGYTRKRYFVEMGVFFGGLC